MADAIDAAISALEEIVSDKTNHPGPRIQAAQTIFDRSYQIRPPSPDENGEKDNPEGDVPIRMTVVHGALDFEAICKKLNDEGTGRFGLSYNPESGPESWTAALEFGEETPGSDMYGGAAYGMGSSPREAVGNMFRDAGMEF